MSYLNSSSFFIKRRWFFILFFTIFYCTLYFFKYREFVLWSQINEFYKISSIYSFKAHTIRILLINSLIYLVQLFSEIDRFDAFNLSVYLVLYFSTIIFSRLVYRSITNKFFIVILFSFIPTIISFFQNGRGVFGCFSILLLFHTLTIKNINLKWMYLIIAAIFANVSSGIFSVFLITIVIGSFNKTFSFIKRKHLIIILLFTSPLFLIYLDKNLAFYDYNLFKLLSHGLGFIFHINTIYLIPIVIIFLVIIFSFFIYLFYINPNAISSKAFPFITSSFIGLFFGFSSFNCFIYLHLFFLLESLNLFEKIRYK
jgi:hypothetical protein